MIEAYAEQIRARGYRVTPQRMTILRILQEAKQHLTPLEIYEQARQELPGLTEATVYRTLSFLSAQGLAMEAHVGNGQLVYENTTQEHHHLICRACGSNYKIDHAVLQELYKCLEAESGFDIDTLHVTFFGLCPDCK